MSEADLYWIIKKICEVLVQLFILFWRKQQNLSPFCDEISPIKLNLNNKKWVDVFEMINPLRYSNIIFLNHQKPLTGQKSLYFIYFCGDKFIGYIYCNFYLSHFWLKVEKKLAHYYFEISINLVAFTRFWDYKFIVM